MVSHGHPCPCCSGKTYEQCCLPFHQGEQPKSALELMRARYSAYVLNLPDYLMDTTHPGSPQYSDNRFLWRKNLSAFSQHSSFLQLKVLDFKEKETLATVTFTAYISQNDEDATFTEKSYFEKINNRWLYRGGQLAEGHAPNLVTTGQLRLLPLAYYGEHVLRRKADFVSQVTNDIKTLVDDMIETMEACDGIGLAAPQVHHSIRLFIIRVPIKTGEETYDMGGIKVFINPVLSEPSNETWKMTEGCLSIPTIRAEVERPKKVTVEYTTLEGKMLKEEVSDLEARVIMHENDHIDGILFIDRLDKTEQKKIKPLIESLEKRIHDGKAF